MNRRQWFVFGIGLIVLSLFLFFEAPQGISDDHVKIDDINIMLLMMYIREYAYTISASISLFLGVLFLTCGFLEPVNKH